ncbi:sigma factor [Streptomyces sp. NPDC002067]
MPVLHTAHPSTPRADGSRSGGIRPPASADALLRGAMERHRPALLRYAARLTSGDPYRAEDIVQETFLRAWLAADRLDLAEEDLHELRATEPPYGSGALRETAEEDGYDGGEEERESCPARGKSPQGTPGPPNGQECQKADESRTLREDGMLRADETASVPPPGPRATGSCTGPEDGHRRRSGGRGEGPGRADTGRGTPRLGSWLFTVAHNLAVDAHRRERAVPVGPTPAEALTRPAGADMADAVVDRCVITQALCRLSPEHRDALVHIHLMDRTGADAAQAMGIPRGTVKSRTHYALLAMRRELAAPSRPTVPRPRLRNTTTRTATNATPPHPADRTTATPPPSPAESAAA